jgi:hypothetical protein
MACASFSFSASFLKKKKQLFSLDHFTSPATLIRQDEKLDYGDVEGCLREWKTKKA